ncbi:MAG: hypothetical protein EOO73_07415 [Myxococcales bacterium]|nr:MAG: hypothetical protein EOO73_07415 [Myxococcales bacterium]
MKLPLLSLMAKNAGCPVGTIEPAAFEKVRAQRLQGDVGTAEAKSHPALGFILGRTQRTDVDAWTTRQGLDCKAGFVASVLECENVASPGAPKIDKLRLQFDDQARLVSVDLFRTEGAAELVSRFEQLGRELDEAVGPATTSVGTPTLAFATSSPLQTVLRSYNYRDYVAKASLMNFGKRGLRLRETYQWLAARPPA